MLFKNDEWLWLEDIGGRVHAYTVNADRQFALLRRHGADVLTPRQDAVFHTGVVSRFYRGDGKELGNSFSTRQPVSD